MVAPVRENSCPRYANHRYAQVEPVAYRGLIYALCLLLTNIAGARQDGIDDLIEVKAGATAEVRVAPTRIRPLPGSFFGLNFEAQIFEMDSLVRGSGQIKPEVIRHLKALPDIVYRYPGGLMANHYSWEWATGPLSSRVRQKLASWAEPAPSLFGVDEYLDFLHQVKGRFWYTLNLSGWSETSMEGELPSVVVAESNRRLASHVLTSIPHTSRFYHLGNELDRSDYEWPTDKYIQRAKDTVAAVRTVDPQARFVAFLRDFDLKYRKSAGGSTYKAFNKAVLEALPMVDDFSFQYYYDDANNGNIRSTIPWRLKMFQAAIRDARDARRGRTPNVWVTEHGRSPNPAIKGRIANKFTSGLAGAISAADFWIAVAQMPAIQGAFLYSVGHWNIFSNELPSGYPTPMYWTLHLLHQTRLPDVMATSTSSPNRSGYLGGYDVRAVALADVARTRYSLWIVNRAAKPLSVKVRLPSLDGRTVRVNHGYVAGREGVLADQDQNPPRVVIDQNERSLIVSADGALELELPSSSISSFRIEREQ